MNINAYLRQINTNTNTNTVGKKADTELAVLNDSTEIKNTNTLPEVLNFSVKKIKTSFSSFFNKITHILNQYKKDYLIQTKKTEHNELQKSLQATLIIEMLNDKENRIVTPKQILSSLTNDGKIQSNGKEIIDYLKKNVTSDFFSSENVDFKNGKLIFRNPMIIPDTAIEIKELVVDSRDSTNGEFRGAVAENVLQDKELKFSSLQDFCDKLSGKDARNISKMRLANAFSKTFNTSPELYREVKNEYHQQIEELVSLDQTEGKDTFKPKFTFDALATPVNWNDTLAKKGTTSHDDDITKSVIEPLPAHQQTVLNRAMVEAAQVDKTHASTRAELAAARTAFFVQNTVTDRQPTAAKVASITLTNVEIPSTIPADDAAKQSPVKKGIAFFEKLASK